jgi:hypothetical protein
MRPEIRREFRILSVPERLNGADDRRGIHAVTFRKFTRREEESVVGIFKDGAN